MNRTHQIALFLFLIALLIYTIPIMYNEWGTPFFHMIPAQDVVSASLLPMSLLTRGDFYLDQYRRYITNNYPEPYFVAEVNNHLVTRYTAMPGILAIPVIGAARGTGWITHTNIVFSAAKLAAALMTAFTLVAFFYVARRMTDLATATFVAIAFAFGTGVWSTASQGLWQHTPSILFQTIALGIFATRIERRCGRRRASRDFSSRSLSSHARRRSSSPRRWHSSFSCNFARHFGDLRCGLVRRFSLRCITTQP
jgi:hypothetical protein